MFAVEVVTPPAALPVTAAELRAHLRLNDSSEDALLESFSRAALELWELATARPVLATVYRQYVARWPAELVLARGGVTAIAAVTRYLADGSTAPVTGYGQDLKTPPARVRFTAGTPGVEADYSPVGYVQFTAGWAAAVDVPADVLTAVKLLAGHFYQNREAYRDSAFELRELPFGFRAVCRKYALGITGDWGQ